jgi:hypothetical protein
MKVRIGIILLLSVMSGCSLFFGSPTATIRKLHSYAEKGDIDGMTKLFSAAALKDKSESQIKENNKRYSDLIKSAIEAGQKPKLYDINETVNGDKATVDFRYGESGKDSMHVAFILSKENGTWKIDRSTPPEGQR